MRCLSASVPFPGFSVGENVQPQLEAPQIRPPAYTPSQPMILQASRMYKSFGPTRLLQHKWLLLPISTMDRSRWYKAADPIAFPFRPPHRLQHVSLRSLYPCFACYCFEIFFLETSQKRLTVVRSSKADSQPKVVVRASSAHIHLRRRNV